MPRIVDATSPQVEIRFTTKQEQYAVPCTPLVVPITVTSNELNTFVNQLLKESNVEENNDVDFDFMINGEFLRSTLEEHCELKNISTEGEIEVEYVERLPAPEPQDCLLHDDWVSSVHVQDKYILTGCYDNSVQIWTIKGKHVLTVTGHTGPVRAVQWVEINSDHALFLSGSHDQSAMLWVWNIITNNVQCVSIYKGHERNVESISYDTSSQLFASAGWDTMLKIWSAKNEDENELNSGVSGERSNKRLKVDRSHAKTPVMTLKGHKDCVSHVTWTSPGELLTSSWDHTLKLWDAELGGMKQEILGNKSFFSADHSQLNHCIITASADRHIRLYDPRSTDGSLVKGTFTSHSGWVQSVKWSTTDERLFISGAYDNMLKLWDLRSPRASLFDLTGHEEKILCCDWSEPSVMASGGADNSLRIYKAKRATGKIV